MAKSEVVWLAVWVAAMFSGAFAALAAALAFRDGLPLWPFVPLVAGAFLVGLLPLVRRQRRQSQV